MRRKAGGVLIITCDARHCVPDVDRGTEFRTASVPKVVDRQLEAAGWTLLPRPPGDPTKVYDLCPVHRPAGRMSGGPPPLHVHGRSTSH